MTQMVMSWCPGDPCDPCKVVRGNIEIVGNYLGTNALCYARGSIISFPEFPVRITANIILQGIYRPFVGPILSPGGSVNTTGTSGSVSVPCPLASTYLNAMAGWLPSGSDQLLFNVTSTSSTTTLATLDITTVKLFFHSESGGITDVSSKARWTGNVE
jgi:hypothetical protein